MVVPDTAYMTDSPTKWHGRSWWQFVGVLVAAAGRDRALAGGGTEVADVRRGTVLCVATDKGNIARLTITRVIKFKGFEADTVVWNANAT